MLSKKKYSIDKLPAELALKTIIVQQKNNLFFIKGIQNLTT